LFWGLNPGPCNAKQELYHRAMSPAPFAHFLIFFFFFFFFTVEAGLVVF
jgi:hypothetical protein